MDLLTFIKYIITSLVQGFGEILPISSSGHLAVIKNLIGLNEDISFDIFLHFASLIAIVLFFRKKLWTLIKDFFLFIFKRIKVNEESSDELKEKAKNQRKNFFTCIYLVIATIPAALLGVGFKVIEKITNVDVLGYLEGSLLIIGILFLLTAALLFISDRIKNNNRELSEMNFKDAIVIGLFQCFGTMPGISRSGSTIVGGKARKLDQASASEFSFLMAIPIILGSLVLDIKDIGTSLAHNTSLILPYIVSFIITLVITYLCLHFFLKFVKKKKLSYFSIYLVVIGVVSIILSFFK